MLLWWRVVLFLVVWLIPLGVYASADYLEAVWQGDTLRTKELLQNSMDVNASDHWGRTALLIAAQKGDMAMAELLFAYQPNVELGNRNGITPLIAAAQRGDAKMVNLILQHGAIVNRTDVMGWTPLMWAARNGNQDCVKALLQAGADVSVRTRANQSLNDLADQYGYSQDVRSILRTPGWNATGATNDALTTITAKPISLTQYCPETPLDRPWRGSMAAPITMIVYTDLQCPYCAESAKTVAKLLQQYDGKLRMVIKHNPLTIHAYARRLAMLYEAIALQDKDKALQFYDIIMNDQQHLKAGPAFIDAVIASLALNMPQLQRDVDSAEIRQRLEDDRQEMARFHFEGVPIFLINGVLIDGAQPESSFIAVVERLLQSEHRTPD